MPITMMYVVTIIMREGYWTEDAVCLTARSAVNLVQNICSGRSRSGRWPTAAPGCRHLNVLLFYSGLVTMPDEKHH